MIRVVLGLGVVALAGCAGSPQDSKTDQSPSSSGAAQSVTFPDSLLVRMPGGYSVWWTLGREVEQEDTTASGEEGSCVERAIEIRKGTTRRLVPLLYTTVPPEPESDTTIRATISTRCVAGVDYLVNLRTAEPRVAH